LGGVTIENWFKELSEINVNDYVREKNGMKYLSWMWAWQKLKERFPLSYSTVHETEDGMLVWRDPIGCHVKTSVTIVWFDDDNIKREHTVTEYLPCMDFRNNAIPYDKVDAMAVNKTIQRSLTKCIARLGIGGYLYMNEDIPETEGKILELQEVVKGLAKSKSKLSDKAQEEAINLCKTAEKETNPDLDDSYITGKIENINDIDVLEKLRKQLLKIRK